ncbi:probable myosin-binding protein 5 [Durio zibethinus]|uniref:Probable myosin-binding protein 5 n=1 Tax=Durio zibethinus TaxID=66656 RepID=A0A6P5YAK2_DURZI|nr:probable myosin-binding protein 5 [Durio zibethinus]
MAKRSFKQFVEQELGIVPKFFIYAVLEWMIIFVLFIDGFLAFFANEFAKFFELPIPCLLCTRIDHVLARRNADFYYNDSICNHHKKNVSSLAFCHSHKKLSDIRNMCESCLLSFATEKESDCDTYKSLLGILHKDIELFVDEDHEVHLSLPAGKKDEEVVIEKSNDHLCSCCGRSLKVKSSYSKGKNSSLSFLAPAPSPRAPSSRNLDLSHIKYTELKHNSYESEAYEHNDRSRGIILEKVMEDAKAATAAPLLMDADDEDKSPNFIRGNKFFGISLSDSATNSPRWTRISRKSPLEKTEFASESGEGQVSNEVEGDILHHLKRQVRMDRKSLMALYMELDEERSASAVAANNAMAMITRLQAEKAAVQMEALQYQRMMEEQAEYDQEALQEMNNLLAKREEELKDLEAELEAYRQNYGCLKEVDFEVQGDESDEGYQILKPPSYSSTNGRADCTSPTHSLNEGSNTGEEAQNHNQANSMQDEVGGEAIDKPKKVSQRARQLGRLKNLEKKPQILSDGGGVSSKSSTENDDFMEEETGNGSKAVLKSELSHIHEKIEALAADDGLLKHVSDLTDEVSSNGEQLLTEISQNIQKLQHIVTMPDSESRDA